MADVDLEDGDIGLSDLTTYYWKVEAVDAYGLITDSAQTWPFYYQQYKRHLRISLWSGL